MFQTISSNGGTIVPGPAIGPLHRSYPYLRLFFGRFLADVSVEQEGQAGRVAWLIPGGSGPCPSPQRLRRELAALGQAMMRAYEEVHGRSRGRSKGGQAVRETMAAQVLREWRVPLSPDDVCFNQSGDLVVINWCLDRPGTSRRLAEWEPHRVIQRLAGSFKVPAPDLKARPKPQAGPVSAPSGQRPPAGASGPYAPPAPGGGGLGQKSWHWVVLGLTFLFVLIAGLAIGYRAGPAKADTLADGSSDPGGVPAPPAGRQTFDLTSSVAPSGAEAMVFHRMGRGPRAYDRVTVWVPLRPEGPLAAQARRFGSLVGADGRAVPGRCWLVYGQDYPHDGARIGPVSLRLADDIASRDPINLGQASRAPTRRYDRIRFGSTAPVFRRPVAMTHWRVW